MGVSKLAVATGFVCVDFRRNNHVVHVRLDYEIYVMAYGYHIEFTNINTQDPSLLTKLKNPEIKNKILGFISDQVTGKLPPTAELKISINGENKRNVCYKR